MLAVIVEFALRPGAKSEFEAALTAMQKRVKDFDGYLGEDACQSLTQEGKFVTVFYWRDADSISVWRNDPEHRRIQELARDRLFSWYRVRVTEVEREYDWSAYEIKGVD